MKVLILGHTGKMGTALMKVFPDAIGKNSKDFDAREPTEVNKLIVEIKPDVVINCVAKLGINQCEKDSTNAYKLNAIYPKYLAELSNEFEFILIHFSTDAVFGADKDYYTEFDIPTPINIYGMSKFIGDLCILETAKKYYIFRLPLLFGPITKDLKDSNQFIDNILYRYQCGERDFDIATDVILVPGYSMDIANRIKRLLDIKSEYGLYHLANSGGCNLYEFTKKVFDTLGYKVNLTRCSIDEFEYLGKKNKYTRLRTLKAPPMRSWYKAIEEYYG